MLPSGETYYYSQDDLGSTPFSRTLVGAVADTDTHTIALRKRYGKYREAYRTVCSLCGQYMDAESGFYYLLARYYAPYDRAVSPSVTILW